MSDEREKEVPRLMTIPEIAEYRGLSRQRVHRIVKSDPAFPAPVIEPGTTRMKYPTDKVDEYFDSRVLRPGRRTDLEAKKQAEESDE
ncbi:helix-turn-helix transcriptional regulator [Streptomyces sp. NPDC008222]|uniref:helix-turn-helix transcriptional regulator n=1 Tax=Streptomyces sp. NPDC008222 TaxID=3364820 RepID=UPI0036EEE1E3